MTVAFQEYMATLEEFDSLLIQDHEVAKVTPFPDWTVPSQADPISQHSDAAPESDWDPCRSEPTVSKTLDDSMDAVQIAQQNVIQSLGAAGLQAVYVAYKRDETLGHVSKVQKEHGIFMQEMEEYKEKVKARKILIASKMTAGEDSDR